MNKIDIFITAYLREELTTNTIRYLKERTTSPYRLFLIDQGGNEGSKDHVDYYIGMSKNVGIHAAWNMAAALAESEYFITSDNDIYVPDVRGNALIPHTLEEVTDSRDWLERLVKFMDERPDYGAISLHLLQ